MKDAENYVTVTIAAVPVEVKCPKEFLPRLEMAAEELNKRLATARQEGGKISRDKMLAIASLNLMHEFLELEQAFNQVGQKVDDQVNELLKKVELQTCNEE